MSSARCSRSSRSPRCGKCGEFTSAALKRRVVFPACSACAMPPLRFLRQEATNFSDHSVTIILLIRIIIPHCTPWGDRSCRATLLLEISETTIPTRNDEFFRNVPGRALVAAPPSAGDGFHHPVPRARLEDPLEPDTVSGTAATGTTALITGTRALVSGATGFLGGHLAQVLHGLGYRVRILVHKGSRRASPRAGMESSRATCSTRLAGRATAGQTSSSTPPARSRTGDRARSTSSQRRRHAQRHRGLPGGGVGRWST